MQCVEEVFEWPRTITYVNSAGAVRATIHFGFGPTNGWLPKAYNKAKSSMILVRTAQPNRPVKLAYAN